MTRDIKGTGYAILHGVKTVYVDTDTGEILQFGGARSKIEFKRKCDGMFPDRKCNAYTLVEYMKLTDIQDGK